MRTLRINEEIAEALAGALLSVARVDSLVTDDELEVIRDAVRGHLTADEELLFFSHVGPEELRAAVDRGLDGDPYRMVAMSSRAEITSAFLIAARRVAAADGSVYEVEEELIAAFARALRV